ncbi:helix-turn-helix domain-containing protein [Bacillus salipaludis]|uniref:Helix-turn-helix domain-containing protein n=1 Tax=Bacillus salipaludis TaxID=2547811 RepID=A0ABW8RPW3_9BACI
MPPKILTGKVIKKYRLIHKISQAELADLCSLSPISISKFERNISEPSFESIVKLAKAFKMEVSEFIKEIEESLEIS